MGFSTPHKTVLLKLSGEMLVGLAESPPSTFGYDEVIRAAKAIYRVHTMPMRIGVVIGGGNIFRGSQAHRFGLARSPADQMGMLATMINGLLLQQILISMGCCAYIMSSFESLPMVESYDWQKALDYLEGGAVVIFVGGTGHPYFTTDTAAALRANQIGATLLLKATKVNGIYDKDPCQYPDARKLDTLTYSHLLTMGLGIMDATAVALCRDNRIEIKVFRLSDEEAVVAALMENEGSLVTGN